MKRSFAVVFAAAVLATVGVAGVAHAQRGPGRIVAASPDLVPIPSRIAHGVVSVRNVGAAASAPSLVTINCHRPGQRGGCVDIPPRYEAAYTDGGFPNRLVVQVPAIQPGHVYNHSLPFWGAMAWPSGEDFQFDYVADAGAANAESNEGNNIGAYVWTVP